MNKLKLLKSKPKIGDTLADVHDGVPSIMFDGMRLHPVIAPVPLTLAKSMLAGLPSVYVNKSLVVVDTEDNHLITAVFTYDDRKASLVTYDYEDIEFTDELTVV